ncbi:MAG: LysE family transporter [Kiloniellales bacterium]|nr:LysE family transporter [Kiloniellales bacterium]
MNATAIDAGLVASLATIVGVWLVTVLSPGPNFLATAQAALGQSRRAGLMLSAGIAVGTTLWSTASLLGLGLLFQTAGWLYLAVKLLGAAYLILLGLRAILSARRTAPFIPAGGAPLSAWQAFRRGLLVDLSNPKAAAFFTSLFAVTVPPAAPLWFDVTVVVAVVVIAGGWYALVACAVSLPAIAARFRRAQRWIAYVTGAAFMALGIRLAVDR